MIHAGQLLTTALALAVLTSAAPRAQGQAQTPAAQTPTAKDSAGEIAFSRASGLIYVELLWDERTPLLALLDTGASASAIDPRVSGHLPAGSRTEVVGTTGTVGAELVAVRGLRLGGAALPELQATRRDLSGLLPLGERRVDVILGSDALVNCALTLDFRTSRLALSGPAPAPVAEPGDSVPMLLDNGIPVIDGSIDGLPLALRIDTGASLFDTPDLYVNVPTGVWEALRERAPELAPSSHVSGTGADGATIELPVVKVRSARVGPLVVESAFIIVQPRVGYFAAPDAKGFVGNNALEKLGRVTLDYAAGRFTAVRAAGVAAGDAVTGIVEQMTAEAAAVAPLMSSPLAGEFLAAITCLPAIESRTVHYDKQRGHAVSAEQAGTMTPEQLEGHAETEIDEAFYYTTRYGSPVAFVRPLEILGQAGVPTADGLELLDFGFGSIGQLRALASVGARAVGVEVDALLEAVYSQPGDTGSVARCEAAGELGEGPADGAGSVALVFGQFPADAGVVERVGGSYDVFVSKNTLKNGYIHPEQPVDPRRLVHLGVDDEAFVRAVFDLLKPGGHALIYNLCPAPAIEGEPYIPWADGRSPFARELYEQVGFVVVAFDADDTPAARAMGVALGWGSDVELEADLFGTYTLLRRPAGP